MEYEITTVTPITEQEALENVAAMGFHGLAFDDIQAQMSPCIGTSSTP